MKKCMLVVLFVLISVSCVQASDASEYINNVSGIIMKARQDGVSKAQITYLVLEANREIKDKETKDYKDEIDTSIIKFAYSLDIKETEQEKRVAVFAFQETVTKLLVKE